MDELPDACLLTLPDIDINDAGPYKVIFPGKLSDNSKFDLTLRIVAWDYSDLVLLSGAIATVIAVVVCFVIGFLCYSKNSRCRPALNQIFSRSVKSNGYEMDSVSIQSSDQKSVAKKIRRHGSKLSISSNDSYSEVYDANGLNAQNEVKY